MYTRLCHGFLLFCALNFTSFPVAALQDPVATALAQQAYYRIMESPFSSTEFAEAERELQRAESIDDKNSWVELTRAELVLKQGYNNGDGFSVKSYNDEALDLALRHARTAVGITPVPSQAYSQLSKVLLIRGELGEAWQFMSKAHQADPATFSPWYLQVVVAAKRGAINRFPEVYAEAEKYAHRPYQKQVLLWERINYARKIGDVAAQESAYKQMISMNSGSAHAHGNYGSFLLRQKRVAEAIPVLERAIALEPYPMAVNLLHKARAAQP